MNHLFGTVVPIITPFDENDHVDLKSLENLTEYVIQGKLQCIYPCGTTGEMLLLSVDERKAILETVLHKASGRIPVFAHVGAMSLKDTLELAKHAVESGADGIGVVTPSYFKLSDQGLIDFYTTVSNSVPDDFSVYLYGIPQNSVNDINDTVAQKITSRCKNVVGIKYSFPDMTLIQKFMLINNGTFSVLVGPDHLFHAVCAVGGDGTVSGNAMIIREHYAALWEAIQANDKDMCIRLQRRTNVLNGILCAKNNISAYKAVLREEGIIRTSKMRAPMEELPTEDKKALFTSLKKNHYKEVLI